MSRLGRPPERAGLIHLSGQRDEPREGEAWGRLRCVLCGVRLPERDRGISQDVWVCVSDARSAGRATMTLELRDGAVLQAPLAFGPMIYPRCDAVALPLEELACTP